MARIAIDPIIRFKQKYIVNPNTNCWEWTALLNKDGYGLFRKDKMVIAHRFSYEYFNGPLDPKLEICHSCNCRKCVNPNHLRQDTSKSNSIDMVKIGNQRNQILSFDEVIQIKKELQNYYHGQVKDLAHFYKVSNNTISGIKNGRTWSHINIS